MGPCFGLLISYSHWQNLTHITLLGVLDAYVFRCALWCSLTTPTPLQDSDRVVSERIDGALLRTKAADTSGSVWHEDSVRGCS